MKYCVLIMDGAADLPLTDYGGRTALELARTPNLDAMAKVGTAGLAYMVPKGFEPDSAVACMSIFGYDPAVFYSGRAPIEAMSLNIPINPGEVLFRCNLVTVQNGTMMSHSAGYISTPEAHELVAALNEALGDEKTHIYPGVSYRNILKLKDAEDTTRAVCTPPHDIPGKPVANYLPRGAGGILLNELMRKSEPVLEDHPVNRQRIARGELPATTIWLFWGSSRIPMAPSFQKTYGHSAAVTSGVNLLHGLGKMAGMHLLDIPGVTDGLDNDYRAQAKGALDALKHYDVVIIHIEAPDEAGHTGSVEEKVKAIEKIDAEVAGQLRSWNGGELRVLVTVDHPTPIPIRTHTGDAVPFLLWGKGFTSNGASRITEAEGKHTGLLVDPGYKIMGKLIGE